MSEPIISVILPTWNRAVLLREAINSVRWQTFREWELLVIDDGSTDDTPAMLAALDEPRLRVIRLDHTGNPARVRNAGLAVASGAYIAFLDSDDLWEPDKLAVQLEGLRQSGCRWSYTAFTRIDSVGCAISDAVIRRWLPLHGWILEHLLCIDAIVPTPTVVVERLLLKEVGEFDEVFVQCEEYELWFRLAIRSRVHVEERSLAQVRVHTGNHQSDREQVHASWARVYAKTAHSLPDSRLAALCRAQRAEHLEALACIAATMGHARCRALALLVEAFPRRWHHLAWWKILAAALLGARASNIARAIRDRVPGRRR